MSDKHPLVVMTDKLDSRGSGHSGYVTTVVELEQILACLSRSTPLAILESRGQHPDEVRAEVSFSFSLGRDEVEALRQREDQFSGA